MRGYLGNSARTRSKTSNRGKGDGPSKKKPRRRRQEEEDTSAFTPDEIIPKSELEKGENLLSLTELKSQPVAQLVDLAESMGIENMGRSRKQDIIFSILKAHGELGQDIYGDGVLEILQDGRSNLANAG